MGSCQSCGCGSCDCGKGCCGEQTTKKEPRDPKKSFIFPQLDAYIDKFSNQATIKDRLKWISAVILIAKYFVNFGTDFWVDIEFFQNGQQAQGISYSVFLGFSTILVGYSLYEAYYIIKSQSMADVFMNNDARRYYNLQFQYWFFYNAAEKNLGKWDKIAMFIYLTLKEWKLLILVQVPQMFITASLYMCKDQSCGSPTPAQSTKFAVLGLQLWMLWCAAFLYPFFKCCGPAHAGANMSLRQYVEFLIDREIAATIKKYLKEHDPQGLENFETEIEKQDHGHLSKTQPSSSVANANDTSSPTSSPSVTPGQSRTDVNIDMQALESMQQDAS
jgi:hypothetical protein